MLVMPYAAAVVKINDAGHPLKETLSASSATEATARSAEPPLSAGWMGLGISLQAENRLPEARDAFSRAKASNTLSAPLLAFVDQKLGQLRQ